MNSIQEKQDSGQTLPNLYKILELFRNNQRLINAQNQQEEEDATHDAFAVSYQDKPASDAKPNRPCLCGVEHRFRDCPYLVESIRPEDWTPDAALQEQIEGKITASPGLQAAVKSARRQAAAAKDKEKDSVSDTETSDSEKAATAASKGSF